MSAPAELKQKRVSILLQGQVVFMMIKVSDILILDVHLFVPTTTLPHLYL